jgi:hypothetical protein
MTPEETAAATAAADAEKATTTARIAALETELAASKATTLEKEQAAQFWYGKANAPKTETEKEKPATEEDVDLLELIGKGGGGFKEWLKKQGLVTRGEVDAMVAQKAGQLVKENQMVDRYPELKDKTSDFFKATSVEYIALKKQSVSDALAMEIAAEKVELAQLRSGKRKIQTDAEKEEERLDRVKAQGGERGRRTPTERAASTTISKEEKEMMKRFGVTEEDYKKSKAAMVVADRA